MLRSFSLRPLLHLLTVSRNVLQKYKLGVPIRDMRLLDPHLATNETGRILVSCWLLNASVIC